MTQETPTEHSGLVGGSTASRRINCPGSLKREKLSPRSGSSPAAREGTALHEVLARILDKDEKPSDLIPFLHKQSEKRHSDGTVEPAWEYLVTQEIWDDLGVPALDMFDDFLNHLEADQDGAPATYMIEERAEFPGIPGAFGTSDVPFRCGKIGGIWDWKMGRGQVDAEDNSQLMFYFAAVLNKYPAFFEGVDRVMLCIGQPQVNGLEPDTWETTLEDVAAFGTELREAIALAQTDDAPIEKGHWCKWADCKAVCELHRGAAVALGAQLQRLAADKAPIRTTTETVPSRLIAAASDMDMDQFLSVALDMADAAEDWAKHIKGVAQSRLEAGLPIAGWKIVPKASAGRVWNPEKTEAQIVNMLRARGMKADEYYKKAIITMPQAEKVLKKLGKELPDDAAVKKPSSGFTLAREADPRHSAEPPREKAAALGASLQRIIETGTQT